MQSWDEPAHDVSKSATRSSSRRAKSTGTASVAGGRGVHLAVNVNVKTEWLEPVSDEDYGG